MVCWLVCVKYEFIINNIKSIKKTNIAYVKNDYINGYNEIIRLKNLETYLKNN